MTYVNLLTANADQLAILLNLSQAEASRLARQSPFASLEALRTAAPDGTQITAAETPKLDINQATQSQLVDGLGLSVENAKLILAERPYFTIFEVTEISGIPVEVPPRLVSAFTGPDLSFVDKTMGLTVALTPRYDKVVIVAKTEEESAGLPAAFSEMGLNLVGANSEQTVYSVYQVDDAESGATAIRKAVLNSGVSRVIPAMRDADGAEIFIDPAFVLVQFKSTMTRTAQQKRLDELGLILERRHRAPGLVTVRVDEAAHDPGKSFSCIAALNALDDVEFCEPVYISIDDQEAVPPAPNSDPSSAEARWNQRMIGLFAAHEVTRGSSDVIIAVIDSGVDDTHPDLQGALLPRGQKDWNFEDPNERRPIDLNGHGTFVAGLVGGAGGTGIAPNCKILPIRVPLRGGVAAYADRRSAILYTLDQVQPGQRLVLSLSWKTARDVASIRTALQTAAERGAIIVASAGNWPQYASQPHFPSDYPFVISVGAVGPAGDRAVYSFYGDNVDLAAPGGAGQGDATADLRSLAVGGGDRTDFGTSFAAPHVAATSALILSEDLALDFDQVLARLSSTAREIANGGLGAGLIDCAASVGQDSQIPDAPAHEQPTPDALTEAPLSGAVNRADLDALVSEFGLLPITARFLIARRMIRHGDQLDGLLGLTAAQRYALLESHTTTPDIHDTDTDTADAPAVVDAEVCGIEQALEHVNSANFEELIQVDGLPPFTARLILVRRPLEAREDLTGLLGMSPEIVDAMSAGDSSQY